MKRKFIILLLCFVLLVSTPKVFGALNDSLSTCIDFRVSLNDTASGGRNCSINSGTVTRSSDGLLFDGNANNITCGSYTVTGAKTYLIYYNTTKSDWESLLQIGNNGGLNCIKMLLNPNATTNNYQITDCTTNNIYSNFATTSENKKKVFAHVNSGANTGVMYINGSGYNASGNMISDPQTTQIYIGSTLTGNWYKGLIYQIMIWNRTITSAELDQIYNSTGQTLSCSDILNPTAPAPPVTSIVFSAQNPSDVTSTTVFSSNVNVVYNYTILSQTLSDVYLNYTVFGGRSCIQFINGSCVYSNNTYFQKLQSANLTLTNSTLINFTLGENSIYPITSNLNESYWETLHSNFTANNDLSFISTTLLNISNSTIYNILELMSVSTGTAKVYACNSSFIFSGSVITNNNCQEIGVIDGMSYNHSHYSGLSQHNIIPFSISSGKIGGSGIFVTPTMYFIVRGVNTKKTDTEYISNTSRQNATYTTTNNGATWTAQTYSVDAHIHQYTNDLYLKYLATGIINGTLNYTASRTDKLDLTSLNPSPPIITNPLNTTQASRYINITWTLGTPNSVGGTMSYYNISLLNSDKTYNRTINASTTNITTYWVYDLYSQNLSLGEYWVMVAGYDNLGLSSFDRESFNLTRNALLNITAGNGTVINNFTINLTDLNNSVVYTNSTTTGSLTFDVIRNNHYTAFIDATGFAYSEQNKTINSTFNSMVFGLVFENSINITIRDESTNALVTQNTSIRFTLSGSPIEYSYYTTTGNLFVSSLPAGNYSIVFTSIDPTVYTVRTYQAIISNRSTQNLNAYLNTGTGVLFTYTDSTSGILLEGVSVTMYRLINGSWVVVESRYTDITGRLQFTFVSNTAYQFISSLSGYTTKTFTLNPILFTSYTVQLDKVSTLSEGYSDVTIYYSPTNFYEGKRNAWTFSISSPSGILSYYQYWLRTPSANHTFNGSLLNGAMDLWEINLSGTTWTDNIKLDIYYNTSTGNSVIANYTFYITGGSLSNYTLVNLKNNDFGLGEFDKIVIVTLITIMVGGLSMVLGGELIGVGVSLLIFGYFVMTGFISWLYFLIPTIIGMFYIMAGGRK